MKEFASQVLREGTTVLRGGTSESEGMPPYLPFLEALGRYIREAPLDQLREQVEPMAQILASILPELASRLGELPAPYPLPPEQMRLRLYEAVGIFIEKISSPRALVLSVSSRVSQLLFMQSEGNPFFAEELMRSWVEKGELVWRNKQWLAAAPLEHALPQSIVGVLRQRFALLSPDMPS